MPKVQVIIRAFTKDGYHKDVIVMDETQVRQHESRVKNTTDGIAIDPAEFPEVVRFVVLVRELRP